MKELARLRALADAATPGPWRAGTHERENVFCAYGATMGPERVLLRMNREFPGFKRDAAFIAAANPAVVLALIAVVEQAADNGMQTIALQEALAALDSLLAGEGRK